LGNLYYDLSEYPLALPYLYRSLEINEALGAKSGMAVTLNTIGSIYQEQQEYDKANEILFQSLKLYEQLDDKRGSASAMTSIGVNLMHKENFQKANEYFNQSLEIAKSIGAKPEIMENYLQLHYSYAAIWDFDRAKKYLECYNALNDSTKINEAMLNETDSLLSDKKNSVTSELKTWIIKAPLVLKIILILIIIVIFILIFLLIRNKQRFLGHT
jgi:tetratricopeptide (TPR) repeat protein